MLIPSLAVPLGAASLAVSLAAKDESPAPTVPETLRDLLPQPYLEMVALDRRPGNAPQHAVPELESALRQARQHDLRVDIGIGHSMFPDETTRPRQLRSMPAYPGDLLDPARSHGDMLVQISGPTAEKTRTARDRLLAGLSSWTVRWQSTGFRPDNRIDNDRALTRNPFHSEEGFGNPPDARGIAERAFVRPDQNEPQWAVGGSYQVVRIIQMATGLWDTDTVDAQDKIIGRRRNGRWLDGTPANERPDFAADPHGRITPLDSHVRLAAPDRRNPPPLVRRGYRYSLGKENTGLIFSCFQRDLAHGFEAVQKRLQHESMAPYLLTTGGGYFFVPPAGDTWTDALAGA